MIHIKHTHIHETILTQIKRDIKVNNNSGIRIVFLMKPVRKFLEENDDRRC